MSELTSPPPEIADAICHILTLGIGRVRALGFGVPNRQCAVEADHIHDLPDLLVRYRPEQLAYYYRVCRSRYIHQSQVSVGDFGAAWETIERHLFLEGLAKEITEPYPQPS